MGTLNDNITERTIENAVSFHVGECNYYGGLKCPAKFRGPF